MIIEIFARHKWRCRRCGAEQPMLESARPGGWCNTEFQEPADPDHRWGTVAVIEGRWRNGSAGDF